MARIKNRRKAKAEVQQASIVERTALYIRVSTEKQVDEGFSLEAQQDRLMAYCKAQGWIVEETDIYIDAGISGKTTDRPEFQRMLAEAEQGNIKRIAALKLDRLSRNTKDFVILVDKLDKWNCDLVLLNENFDTSTPMGKGMITMFAVMAEIELSNIQERTMTGRRQKAKQGGNNGKRCPHGYKFEDGCYIIDTDNSGLIVDVFTRFNAGDTMSSIAKQLNNEKRKTARKGKWYTSTISYMLANGFYAGLVQYDDTEALGEHEAIITMEMYNQVQDRIRSLRPGPQNK